MVHLVLNKILKMLIDNYRIFLFQRFSWWSSFLGLNMAVRPANGTITITPSNTSRPGAHNNWRWGFPHILSEWSKSIGCCPASTNPIRMRQMGPPCVTRSRFLGVSSSGLMFQISHSLNRVYRILRNSAKASSWRHSQHNKERCSLDVGKTYLHHNL